MCQSTAATSNTEEVGNSDLPAYGKFFRNVYTSVPTVNVPFTNLPILFVLVSASFLISVRLTGRKVLESLFGWPVDDFITDRAASSIPAIVHSSLLCPGLIAAFMARKYRPTEHISKASQAWQDLVNGLLEFCTGYMVNDTFFLILRAMPADSWVPSFEFGDILFLGHHAMTSIYMTQARVYKAGHMSAMMCMLLGELSNPLHNTYYIVEIAAGLDCCNGEKLQILKSFIPPLFAMAFIFLRVVAAPIVLLYTTYDLLFNKQGKENLPLWVRLFWSFMIWAVLIGSIPEIMTCKGILMEHMNGAEQEL